MAVPCDVLVVDDEEVVTAAAKRILSASGYQVAIAADGAEARAHPAVETAQLVLCDLMLPDQSGVEVMRVLRSRRPELAFVMMTGYAVSPEVSVALAMGARALLAKPFDEDELLSCVRKALSCES